MEPSRLRSPLKRKSQRPQGQPPDEGIETLFWDELGPPFLFAFVLAILAAFEWLAALTRAPPQPWLFTGFAVAASVYAAWKFAKLRARFRAVAEELDKLRTDGVEVIQDVQPMTETMDRPPPLR